MHHARSDSRKLNLPQQILIDAEIADELGKPATSIRRCIGSAKSTETNSGWIRRMERTLAKRPLTPKTKSARKVASCKPSVAPAEKVPRAVIKEAYPVKNDVHSSTAQQTKRQTKRMTSSSSTSGQVRPAVNLASSDKESRPGEHEPKTNLVDLYMRGRSNLDKM